MVNTRPADDELASARCLVTGASGFIGSHLCRRLTAAGAQVDAVSRRPGDDDGGEVRWHAADLADAESTAALVARLRPDYVFHLASFVAGSRDLDLVLPTFRDNLASTVNLLNAVARSPCRRLLLAGSMEEPEGDGVAVPSSPYAAAKWAAAGYVRFFHAIYDTPATIARIFMVYGPDQKDLSKLVPYVTLSLLAGETPALTSGTRQVDWIYVEDVVDGLLALAASSGVDGETVDLGSGELATVGEVAEMLRRIVGGTAAPELGALADRRLEQVRVAGVEATWRRIGWRPRVGLREGLERTVAWYRRHRGRLGRR